MAIKTQCLCFADSLCLEIGKVFKIWVVAKQKIF